MKVVGKLLTSSLPLLLAIGVIQTANMRQQIPDSEKDMWPSEEAEAMIKQLLTDDEPLSDSVDWRQVSGRVSSVKSQAKCDSCWAFSLAGMLEGQQAIVLENDTSGGNFTIVDLSVQNIIDCNPENLAYYYNGCGGGKLSRAVARVKGLGGIMAEKDYPYEALDGDKCKFNKSLAVMGVKSFGFVNNGSELDLLKLVARYGPVSVRLDAGGELFLHYKSGVHFDPSCDKNTFRLSHYVLVVGYGTDNQDGDYWLVKNSWGQKWGEEGYIRMARNKDSNCGIAHEIYVVLI